ncbi:MAG: hypothetical protein AB1722_06455 [Pseudomonadota bacterium]
MKKLVALFSLAFFFAPASQAGNIVVIGNESVPKMDMVTIQKVFTGKVISVAGVSVKAVNAQTGMPTREAFLQAFLNQDDEKYIAYWTVRRYIGKGAPPLELASDEDIIRYVQENPGAVAYIDEDKLKPGMNVVARR